MNQDASEAAITAPKPSADSNIKVIDAVIPPKMVATVLRVPWLMACDTQSKAEGPGDKITAPAKDTYNNQIFQDIAIQSATRSATKSNGLSVHPGPKTLHSQEVRRLGLRLSFGPLP